MARTLLLSGGGDFDDPWHPFAATSARIAAILRDAGHAVTVSDRVAAGLADLDAASTDLLVLNAGNGGEPLPGDEDSVAALTSYLAAGGGLLAVHVTATAFPDVDAWESALGGRWVRGTTMHPEIGPAHVRVATGTHPVVADIADFDLVDERYSYLRVDAGVTVLASHEHEGRPHPLAWARTVGAGRVVYDALGHEPGSYDSAEHVQLVRNAAAWLTEHAPAGRPASAS